MWGYVGASGSGKGLSVKLDLQRLKPRRLLVWDARAEYAAHAEAASLPAIVSRVAAAGQAGAFRLRYVPGGQVKPADAFAVLCQLAMRSGGLVLLAEELSDVTSPSWAPPAWRQVTTQGRHRDLIVMGCAQRPAMIDKAFLGNCTRLRVGVLEEEPDRRAIARRLDVPQSVVNGLEAVALPAGGVRLGMLERDRYTRQVHRVTLTVDRRGRVSEARALLDLHRA